MAPQRVVFFAPFSGIWPHAYPEALVASSLKQEGAEITYVPCDGLFADGCAVMDSHGMTHRSSEAQRQSVCRMCRRRQDALVSGLKVRRVSMDSFVSEATRGECKQIAQGLAQQDIATMDVGGFKLGRISLHETAIHFKLTSLDELNEDSLADFRMRLYNVLLSMHVARAMIASLEPQRIVAYNTHVSIVYIMMLVAERGGVPTFGIHAGGNMSNRFGSLYIFRRDMVRLYKGWIDAFEQKWRLLPATRQGIEGGARHFSALTSGKTVWVYSAPKKAEYFDVRAHYGIRPDQRVLLAMLSSYDEMFSSQIMGVMPEYKLLFESQVEWLNFLLKHLAGRPDLFLIIRVHPRELPNQRDSVHSNHAKRIAAALEDLPANVKINWPQENISLYDLIPHVDVGLNGWSSTGKELAQLGVPVILYNKDILYYPSLLNTLANSELDYVTKIDQAIESGWSFDRIVQVFRWLALEYTLGTVDIRDSFSFGEGRRSFLRRAMGKLRRMLAYRLEASWLGRPLRHRSTIARCVLEDADMVTLQYEEQGALAPEQELDLIRAEMRKLVGAIYAHVPAGRSANVDALRSATGVHVSG